jgi:putative Mn2+ efflux pump MntP
MEYFSIIILGLGLSMDTFAVSISDGLSFTKIKKRDCLTTSVVFGLMQGIMPLLGALIGTLLSTFVDSYLKYISFGLMLLIGAKMIFEGLHQRKKTDEINEKEFSFVTVLVQSVATSLDALALGVTLVTFQVHVLISAMIISVITFGVCMLGLFLGGKFGSLFKDKRYFADILGGVILVALGISFLF